MLRVAFITLGIGVFEIFGGLRFQNPFDDKAGGFQIAAHGGEWTPIEGYLGTAVQGASRPESLPGRELAAGRCRHPQARRPALLV